MNILALLRSINPLDLRGSWKTSLCGIVALLAIGASELELFPEHKKEVEYIGMAALGIGAMMARDSNKSSEDEGLNPKEVK